MNRGLSRQSNLQLTQDPSSHKLPALPICTLIENHREIQLKLFDYRALRQWPQAPGSSCKVIRVLIHFYCRVTQDKWRLVAGQQELAHKEDPWPASVSLTGTVAKICVTEMDCCQGTPIP